MHELGIVQRILEVVLEQAGASGAERVTDVHIEIGPEAEVDSDAVSLYWPIVAEGSIAEHARLDFTASTDPKAVRVTRIQVDEEPAPA